MDKPILTLADVSGATTSGNGESQSLALQEDFVAEVNAVEDETSTSLDVVIQDSFDGGVTWHDWITFTSLTGTGTEVKGDQTTRPCGGCVRVEYTIVGGKWSFTVKLAANPKQ